MDTIAIYYNPYYYFYHFRKMLRYGWVIGRRFFLTEEADLARFQGTATAALRLNPDNSPYAYEITTFRRKSALY